MTAETWTEKTRQGETWAAAAVAEDNPRVFTPRVFASRVVSGRRVFDTGSPAGLWDEQTEQYETWTVVT